MADNWRDRARGQGFEPVPFRMVTELAATELADGSVIEVTDPQVVPMGDVYAHRKITLIRHGDASGRPECKVVFEVQDGVPVCVGLQLGSPETPVRAKHLNSIRLEDLRDDAYAAAGVFIRNANGGFVRKLGFNFHRDRKQVQSAAATSRLDRVADIHNSTPAGGRIEAIRAAFTPTPHKRTALRWIAAAREAGLINE